MDHNEENRVKLPKKDAVNSMREFNRKRRRMNFRNRIFKRKLIEFAETSPWSTDEPDGIGIQWFTGIQAPSWLFSYPDQSYWKTFELIFMFRRKRWNLVIRGKKMPYKNFEEYNEWRKIRCKNLK